MLDIILDTVKGVVAMDACGPQYPWHRDDGTCIACSHPRYLTLALENIAALESGRTTDSYWLDRVHGRIEQGGRRPGESPDGVHWGERRAGTIAVGFWGPMISATGGTEEFHRLLAANLDRSRISAIGYASLAPADPAMAEILAGAGLSVGSGEHALLDLAGRVDVLVAWGMVGIGSLLGRLRRRPRLVAVSHGDRRSGWTTACMGEAALYADRFAGVAPVSLETIPTHARDRARIIANGADPDRVRPRRDRATVRAEIGVNGIQQAILLCQRYSPEKRWDLALEILAALPTTMILILAGPPPPDPIPEPLARRVRILGVRRDVGDLMGACDLYLSTSEIEGFGLATAEAMLAGLPVVAMRRGFLDERPDLARIVPDDASPSRWASQVMAAFLDSRKTDRTVKAARAHVLAAFAPARFGAEWSDLIAETASLATQVSDRNHPESPRETALATLRGFDEAQRDRVERCPHKYEKPGCCDSMQPACRKGHGHLGFIDTTTCILCVAEDGDL